MARENRFSRTWRVSCFLRAIWQSLATKPIVTRSVTDVVEMVHFADCVEAHSCGESNENSLTADSIGQSMKHSLMFGQNNRE